MKNLKPFSLEAAKAGEPIVTRDGLKAKFIAHVPQAESSYRVIVFVEGTTRADEFYEDGKYCDEGTHNYDLVMESKVRTVFVNFYKNGNAVYYETEEYARQCAYDYAIAIAIPVEITE